MVINFLVTVMSFILALGILIIFHEFGHYIVAKLSGVKILRFSVGLGSPIINVRLGIDKTEWVIAPIPLGGYVKMLDEREGAVKEEEVHRAFNRQPLFNRVLIVIAGPCANFLLAIVFYWILMFNGVPGLKPVVQPIGLDTPAARANIQAGDEVLKVEDNKIKSWQELRWNFLEIIMNKDKVSIETRGVNGQLRFIDLDLHGVDIDDPNIDPMKSVGLERYVPYLDPIIGKVITGGAADRYGLQVDDRVIAIGELEVKAWRDLVRIVRASPGLELSFTVVRDDETLLVPVTLDTVSSEETESQQGRLGVSPRLDSGVFDEYRVLVKYQFFDALAAAIKKSWEVGNLTLKMLWRMLIGEASLKNLSGPITIADYAGQSAQMGWITYLNFLALISIGIGILNLLPIPILDGGHLLFFCVEAVKGSPVSRGATEVAQQFGAVLLFSLMIFAIFNDMSRIFLG